MCDTLVVTPAASRDGVMLFGKNSDRQPNEAHQVLVVQAADHAPGSQLQCTYRSIPQAAHTHAVLLAKPFWMWGAEMGANEHGVAIGNEAVFTKVPQKKEPALTGMDLLRLALERAISAAQAVQVITELLAEFGQGGNCGYQKSLYYHNSYLVADAREAFVLETAGEQWAAKQVHGIYTISNRLSLGNEWDMASPDLVNYAVERGWCKSRQDFDFSRCYSEPLYTYFAEGYQRSCRTRDLLKGAGQGVQVLNLMQALRDHGDEEYRPERGITSPRVCAHASFGPIRSDQTTGSMVSHLHEHHPTHWVTGTAAPCTSLFKPVWLEAGLPDVGADPGGEFDPQALFWRHEQLHRTTLKDYDRNIRLYANHRDELEALWTDEALFLAGASPDKRLAFSTGVFQQADEARESWLMLLNESTPQAYPGRLYRFAWQGINRKAGWDQEDTRSS